MFYLRDKRLDVLSHQFCIDHAFRDWRIRSWHMCTLWRWLLLNKGSKNNVIRYSGIYLIKRALIKGVSLSQVKIRLLRSAGICSRSSASCSHSQRAAQRKAGLGDIPSTLIWLWFNTHYSGGEVLSLAIQQGCNSPPLLIMIGILKKRRL